MPVQTLHKRVMRMMPWLFYRRGMVWWCLLGCLSGLRAQDVLMPPPAAPILPDAVQQHQNASPMQVFPRSASAPNYGALTEPFEWGPFVMRPHLSYRFLYGNGIQSSPGQQQNSIVQSVAPGVLFDLGRHWTLDYTPTLTFYSSRRFRNTLNHDVRLGWGSGYGSWFLTGSQSYTASSDPNVETAGQTDRENYSTALNASYLINSKLSLDLGLGQNFNYVGNAQNSANSLRNLTDSRQWSTMDWLNYQFWPRLNIGLGIGAGYVNVSAGPDVVNEQYQGRINWRATDKISFALSGGLQDQQYLSGGASDLLTPIFSAAIQYQPFEQTRLSVSASRTVSSSYYFENQTTENTGITGDLNQRLLGKLFLDLSGGYRTSRYVSSATVANQIGYGTGRTDDYYSFSARLTCPFPKRGTFSVFYQYSENSSSQTGFLHYYQASITTPQSVYSYTSSQMGFEIGYRY